MPYICKYQLYPSEEQKRLIEIIFGCSRFIYNYCIQKTKELYEQEHKWVDTYNYSEDISKLKKEKNFLKNIDSTALKSAFEDYDRDYSNFVKSLNNKTSVEYLPYRAKKDKIQKYRVQQIGNNIKILEKKIRFSKLGEIKCEAQNIANSKNILDEKIISVTVLKDKSGMYFADVLCEE